uniref:Putative RAB6-interacting golgin n=1 Tax=Helianthus annuus TaxID=4232 RepID=A0A251SBL6_HELAN
MSCLNPCNGFFKFIPSKILAFAKMYPDYFTTQEIWTLLGDIESFRHTISDDNFANLNVINDLASVMVETGTYSSSPSVYRVVKLALLLAVARSSSATVATVRKKIDVANREVRSLGQSCQKKVCLKKHRKPTN